MNSYNVNNINNIRLKNWLKNTAEEYKAPLYKIRFFFLMEYIKINFPKEKDYNKILDVGCGSGLFVKELKKDGYDIIGIDEYDTINIIPNKDNFNFVSGNALNLPFEDNSFDLILCFEVLEHILEYDKAVKEINRCLKKDGVFLAVLPNLFCYDSIEGTFKIISSTIIFINIIRKAFGLNNIYQDGYSTHIYKFFPPKWRKEMVKNNFNTIEDFPIYISPYIPEKITVLKKIEEWVYNYNVMLKIQNFLSKALKNIPILRYTGQIHFFIFKKK